jgi:hypothetical protein
VEWLTRSPQWEQYLFGLSFTTTAISLILLCVQKQTRENGTPNCRD